MNKFMANNGKWILAAGLAVGLPFILFSPPKPLADFFGGEQAAAEATLDGADEGNDYQPTPVDPAMLTRRMDRTAATSPPTEAIAPLDPAAADRPLGSVRLVDVLQFHITPTYVKNRWPRVATLLSDNNHWNYRLPLSTGTKDDDLVGVLTYSFDTNGVLQKIEFEGGTDDYRTLTRLLQQYFGFLHRPMQTPYAVVYERLEDAESRRSFVWIEPAPDAENWTLERAYRVTLHLWRL